MTNDQHPDMTRQTDIAGQGVDAPLDPDRPGATEAGRLRRDDVMPDEVDPADEPEPNPWLREGADAPDAADIEDPTHQL